VRRETPELLPTSARFLDRQQGCFFLTAAVSREVPMPNAMQGAGRVIAAASAGAIVALAVVVLSATVIGGHLVSLQTANAAAALTPKNAGTPTINREGKGDKLPVNGAVQTRNEIKSVEVIGLRGAAIVYRDRNGNVLFRTDPIDNVTVVTKNVDLPEVTIRENHGVQVERVPVDEAGPAAPLHGCESAFARPAPESLTRAANRCVTELNPSNKFAALD
jgi:hypothetical protein